MMIMLTIAWYVVGLGLMTSLVLILEEELTKTSWIFVILTALLGPLSILFWLCIDNISDLE